MKKLDLLLTILVALCCVIVSACIRESGITAGEDSYSVIYSADEGGLVEGNSIQTVAQNQNAEQVTAVPDEGYYFVGWSDGITDATRTDYNISSDISVTAIFEKISLTVIYKTDGNGSISGESTQHVKYNEHGAEITAVPAEGYKFVSWSDGVTTASRTDTNITADIDVTAEFEKIIFMVMYNWEVGGSLSGKRTQYVAYGESATAVTAVASADYYFIGWSDGITTEERHDTEIYSDIDVTAQFAIKTYKVNYYAAEGGKLQKDSSAGTSYQSLEIGCVIGGTTTTVTAVPNGGYVFVAWSDGNTNASRQIKNVRQNYILTAYFGHSAEYSVYGEGGTISGVTSQKAVVGESFDTVTAVPAEGYVFSCWSDRVPVATRTDISSENIEYIAFFEPVEKTFTYDYGSNFGMPLATLVTINRNAMQSADFVIPSMDGYTFGGWYADSEYTIKVANENGRYMLGYYGLNLNGNKLYAKWISDSEELPVTHKILIVIVENIEATLYSGVSEKDMQVSYNMNYLERQISYYIPKTVSEYPNSWFDGSVQFEVDAYYTTGIVDEDSFTHYTTTLTNIYSEYINKITYLLEPDSIREVSSDLIYDYDAVLSVFSMNDFANYLTQLEYGTNNLLHYGSGNGLYYGCINYEDILTTWIATDFAPDTTGSISIPSYYKLIDVLQTLEADSESEELTRYKNNLVNAIIHEYCHIAENACNLDYYCHYGTFNGCMELHSVINHYTRLYGANIEQTEVLRRYLLGIAQNEDGGEYGGVFASYWTHEAMIRSYYRTKTIDSVSCGYYYVTANGETKVVENVGVNVEYGSTVTVVAVAVEGYSFVMWSDGITTAERTDTIYHPFDISAIYVKNN